MSDPRPPDDGPSWPEHDIDRREGDSGSWSEPGQPSDDQPTNRWWERPQDDSPPDEPWPDAPWVRQPRTDQPPSEQPPPEQPPSDEPAPVESDGGWDAGQPPGESGREAQPAERQTAADEPAEGLPPADQPAEPWQEPAADREGEPDEPREEWQARPDEAADQPPAGEPWGTDQPAGEPWTNQPSGTEPWASGPDSGEPSGEEPRAEEPWQSARTTDEEPSRWEPGESTWLDSEPTQAEPSGEREAWEATPDVPSEPSTHAGPFGWPSRRSSEEGGTPEADAVQPPGEQPSGADQPASEPPAEQPWRTEPPAAEPWRTEPPSAEPWGTEPPAAEPPDAGEQAGEPWATEPSTDEPWTPEPSPGEPWAAETPGGEQPPEESRPAWPGAESLWEEPPLTEQPQPGEPQAEERQAWEAPPEEHVAEETPAYAWGGTPAADEPFGEQPEAEQPPAEQAFGDEPSAEQPPAEPQPGEEPPREPPPTDDQPGDEPPEEGEPSGVPAVAAAPVTTYPGSGDGWDPSVDGERRRATTAEQAVPWMIGIILALAGIVIVLLALIFTFPGGLVGSASPTPTPSATGAAQSDGASPSVQASSTEAPTETPAPTPTPTPVPVYGPLEMVYLGRPSALAPIYLLRRDFSVDTDPTVMAQAEQGVTKYAWSPDGRYGAAIIAGRAVALTPGESARSLADNVTAISWGWDSQTLYAVRITRSGANDSTEILRINFTTADVQTLATLSYEHPVTAPDPALKEAQFIDDGGLVRLYATADGNLVLWVLGAPSTYRIDPGDGSVTDAPGQPTLWAPDGRQRVTLKENSNGTSVLTLLSAGGDALASTQVTGLVSHIRWAPKSNEIVFTLGHLSNAGGVRQDLYVWNLGDGKAAEALTSNAVSFGAAWVGVAPNWMPASP